MPDSLDVAVQRKRIEELQRHGQSTQEAEARLRAMLEAVLWCEIACEVDARRVHNFIDRHDREPCHFCFASWRASGQRRLGELPVCDNGIEQHVS
jgi:hypothetical protein